MVFFLLWMVYHPIMNNTVLESVFGTRGRIAVLRVLANVGVPLSIREIARQAGLTHGPTAEALDHLVAAGAVSAVDAGRARVHWLERRSLLVQRIVLPAFAAESESEAAVLEELRKMAPHAYALVLFGSRARGDFSADSDYDLLLVERSSEELHSTLQAIDEMDAELRARLGAPVSVLGHTLDEALDLRESGNGMMQGVLRDGVTIVGVAPRDWRSSDEAAKSREGQRIGK